MYKRQREGFTKWLKEEKKIHITDTTFRDAHQSLLATRVRTRDLVAVAESYAKNHSDIFSMEVWGGATFDVAMRFLHECPWKRLQQLREKMPNVLLQMLLRGSNGVGYKAYPDNLIEEFIQKASTNGIDIFRIFDSLNWIDNMKVSIKTVVEKTNSLAEVCIGYTGDILDPNNTKYNLQYYVDLAKRIEDEGAHILAIKDMAGLLKPLAASKLIPALKEVIDIPIHLHTHDTSSIQSTTYQAAIDAGVDVIDCALSSMSGLTSQPNMNSVIAMLKTHDRDPEIDLKSLQKYSNYWEDLRELYYPFETGLKAGTAEVYDHEIPGGQYSNLKPQAASIGLIGEDFEKVKENYAVVNRLFGNIVKVTPSSKVVGDMAIFMTSNNLTTEDVLNPDKNLAFPESVVSFFKGELGKPEGGFPKDLQKIILKGKEPLKGRPNEDLQPVAFDKEFKEFQKQFGSYADFLDFLSYKLYPKVFRDFYEFNKEYGYVTNIPTKEFFYGPSKREGILVPIDQGKTIAIKMMYILEPNEHGMRTVGFELNGQTRRVQVKDKSFTSDKITNKKASGDKEIGAPLQGRLSSILVKPGQEVQENEPLFTIEAMKMETTIAASSHCVVKSLHLKVGDMVQQDDLVVEVE